RHHHRWNECTQSWGGRGGFQLPRPSCKQSLGIRGCSGIPRSFWPRGSHMSRMTQQQLESYLWGAAVLLRGLIDAGDYKQFIFPLLFFKRVSDVWDEEYQIALKES